MPRQRPPREVWFEVIRPAIWNRDRRRCVRCEKFVSLVAAHIDHMESGELGSNKFTNLRVLCRRCHVLRADSRHRGMTARALQVGDIPPNWRKLIWEG